MSRISERKGAKRAEKAEIMGFGRQIARVGAREMLTLRKKPRWDMDRGGWMPIAGAEDYL